MRSFAARTPQPVHTLFSLGHHKRTQPDFQVHLPLSSWAHLHPIPSNVTRYPHTRCGHHTDHPAHNARHPHSTPRTPAAATHTSAPMAAHWSLAQQLLSTTLVLVETSCLVQTRPAPHLARVPQDCMQCSRVIEMYASVELTLPSCSLPRFAPTFRGRVWSTPPRLANQASRPSRPLPRVCTSPRVCTVFPPCARPKSLLQERRLRSRRAPFTFTFCVSVLQGGVSLYQSMRAFWDLPSGETMVMSTPEAIT